MKTKNTAERLSPIMAGTIATFTAALANINVAEYRQSVKLKGKPRKRQIRTSEKRQFEVVKAM